MVIVQPTRHLGKLHVEILMAHATTPGPLAHLRLPRALLDLEVEARHVGMIHHDWVLFSSHILGLDGRDAQELVDCRILRTGRDTDGAGGLGQVRQDPVKVLQPLLTAVEPMEERGQNAHMKLSSICLFVVCSSVFVRYRQQAGEGSMGHLVGVVGVGGKPLSCSLRHADFVDQGAIGNTLNVRVYLRQCAHGL